jgi:starch phosphorylase
MRGVSDSRLWECRASARQSLVEYVRERLSRQLEASGASPEEVDGAKHIFDVDALTLGFARRFAPYKRPNLLLHDPARLLRILTDEERPVQLVVAGKAHPADEKGQAMVREWVQFSRRPEARGRVMFVPDYDMTLAERLVQGADVWINTPRRPWEASGTSGMKVLVNGGLNVSELDGWWAEAYAPEVGWALGDGQEHGDDPAWDAAEAEALYMLLEQAVVPAFYDRDARGIPSGWTSRMRESMARLTPWFSANRSVWEYTERYYLPAAVAYVKRSVGGGKLGGELVGWKQHLARHLYGAHFGGFSFETQGDEHHIAVEVQLGELHPDAVHVELCSVNPDGIGRTCRVMARAEALPGPGNGAIYRAVVPSSRPATDYTPRLVPFHPDASVPLESSGIVWQR